MKILLLTSNMHRFTIDYTDGYKIDNTFVDKELIQQTGQSKFGIRTSFTAEKIKRSLVTYPDKLGITCRLEETSSSTDNIVISYNDCDLGCWMIPILTRYFVPYFVEILYNHEVVFTDKVDCKFKLVNFTLNPKDNRELYVWMNVIEKFKKEMQCNISIKNDTVFSTREFDDIVDVKHQTNDPNRQYYLGLFIGRYYQPNSQQADYFYHPDGLHNKNSLDIINDILYYHTRII